jgi:hypothetical protein
MLTIIGPYPTLPFIETVARELGLANNSIYVLADESWSPSEIQKIRTHLGNDQVKLVRTKNGQGIVHAKLYLIKYRKRNARIVHRLIIGSTNASRNAINNNAEAEVSICLSMILPEDQTRILDYFERIRNGGNANRLSATSRLNNCVVDLPAIYPANAYQAFYAWIRSGRLCYKYEMDNSFGNLIIKLSRPLPETTIAQNVARHGENMIDLDTNRSAIRLPYFPVHPYEGNRNTWKTKFGVETKRGLWISNDCYSNRRVLEIAPVNQSKQQDLGYLIGLTKADVRTRAIQAVADIQRLVRAVPEIKDYLGAYSVDSFIRKINSDIQLAGTDYAQRYVTGWSIEKVPKLDKSETVSFAKSMLDTVFVKQSKRTIRNLFASKVIELDAGDSSEEALKEIVSRWDRDHDFANTLINYYRVEN